MNYPFAQDKWASDFIAAVSFLEGLIAALSVLSPDMIKFHAKLVASEDLLVFTKRGWTGMDTFYVASSDTSMLNKIHSEITATNNYNKQFGAFNKSYQQVKEYRKSDLIKEEDRGLNFIKSEKGWNIMK